MAGVAVLAVLSGCVGDRSTLDPAGPAARDMAWLWWGMSTFAFTVLAVVVALWLYTFWRDDRPRREARIERRIARRWIVGGGVLLPGLTIALLLMLGVPLGKQMLPLPLPGGESPQVIEVIGHQWWWEIRYPDGGNGEVVTANRLVLPAGEPVDFHVSSDDVIHSFWVPRLGGKVDMIPGRTNRIRLEADRPGTFGGQCAEFCGEQHANMRLQVEAMAREDFEAWLAARQTAPSHESEEHAEARQEFSDYCGSCHRVDSLSQGREGPDLTDLGSRPSLGAGKMPMREGAVAHWLMHHKEIKPGNRMPRHDHLDVETLERIGAWLETLEP